ncbi:MAG: folate-binding protein [Pseudomonadota bacterium]
MSATFAYLPERGVLALRGPDTIALLERLITSTTSGWTPGEARFGGLLTPQGKIIADFVAVRTGEGVLLDAPKAGIGELEKRLKLFRLRADVEIAPLEGVIILAGVEPAEHGVRPVSGAQIAYLDPRVPGGRLRAIASETEWRQYHGHEAEWALPTDAYEADRIAAGVPDWGPDYGAAEVFPADVNMDRLGGVDYKKGCFVGQEVVSRMYRRGKIRKRTFAVTGEGLSPGAEVVAPGPVGRVTSCHGARGLACLRLDRVAKALKAEATLSCGGHPLDLKLDDGGWLHEELEGFMSDA